MSLLERINQRVGFTRNESLVVLFLVGTLLFGGAIKLTQELTGTNNPQYDYTAADQEFAARSQHIDTTIEDKAWNSTDSQTFNSSTQTKKSQSSTPRKLKSVPSKKINVNTATKEELMSLPGVGETTAERIIIYREDHGPFLSIDDLLSVKGIGKKKLERLVPYIIIQ